MKIVLVGRYGEGDILTGPERVARELFSELTKNNIQAVFVDYYFSGYEGSSLLKKIFGKEYNYDNSVIRLGIIPLISFFRKSKFDIIHIINIQRFILLILLLNKFLTGKLVTTMHGFIKFELPDKNYWLQRYFFDKWVEKLSVKKSRLLIFPSSLLLNTFKQYYKISDDSCMVIPNGISKIFVEQERKFPAIDNSLKIIFYNGFNDSINRGLDKLLNLMNNLKFEVELYVIGGKVEVKPEKNIKIYFAHPMSHAAMINFVSDKHFIIKSSAFDTFSILVAECMALGLIPIISEKVGISDVIEHTINGFIYDSSKEEDFPELLNQISNRNFNLAFISDNAKRVTRKLNWGKISEEYISAYKSVL